MKPKDQSLAIAYGMKRKKKMAQGGMVNESAKSEHKPMPEETDKDKHQVEQNSSMKPPKNDSWSSQPERKQAGMGKTFPLKHPKMVPSDVFSSRLRNQEDHLESSAKVNNGPQHQPPKEDDEMGPDRQGPSVPSLKMKRMFEGGVVSEKDSENDMVEHPAGLESDDDQMKPSEDEIMSNHFAKGGHVELDAMAADPQSRPDRGYGAIIVKRKEAEGGEISPEDEEMDEHHSSIAAAIMAKRRKMAEGGSVNIDSNAEEQPNDYYSQNQAALKENYDSDMDGVSQPMDSNEHGHELSDEDAHDMVSAIRRKMKSMRG